jgi:hypothetical protein
VVPTVFLRQQRLDPREEKTLQEKFTRVRTADLQFMEWAQRVSTNPQGPSLLFTLGVSGHIGMFAVVEAAGSTAHVPNAATAAELGVAAAAAGLTMCGLRMALRGALEPVAVGGRGADKGGGDGVLEEIGSPVQWEDPPATAPLPWYCHSRRWGPVSPPARSWRASLQRTLSTGCLATSGHLAAMATGLRCASLTVSCNGSPQDIGCIWCKPTRRGRERERASSQFIAMEYAFLNNFKVY